MTKLSKIILISLFSSLIALLMFIGHAKASAPLNYPINDCLSFDGVDDYVSCGYSSIFGFNSVLTIETWVKPRFIIKDGSDADYGHRFGQVISRTHIDHVTGYELYFDYLNGYLAFGLRSGPSTYRYHTDKSLWLNTSWYHLAVTYNRTLTSGNLKFYINGTLDSEHDSQSIIMIPDEPLQFGKRYAGSAYGGLIDEVRVWNISRTLSEILSTMNRTLNSTEVTNPNLVGYWHFDEGTGIISEDYSNYNNDAALASTPANPQWTSPGCPIIPEFPTFMIISLFMIATLVAAIVYRIKRFH